MNKKGQFYLIAAIIIVLVVFSLTSIVTYSFSGTHPKSILEISQSLTSDSPEIIKFGVFNAKNITSLLENFSQKDFAGYLSLSPDLDLTNITFIYGNESELYTVNYFKDSSGMISLGSSGLNAYKLNIAEQKIIPPSNPIILEVLGKSYTFNLKGKEVFYFVIKKEKDGEIYIQTNSPTD